MKRLLSRTLVLVFALTLLLGVAPAAALNGDTERAADVLYTLGLIQGSGEAAALRSPASRAQAAVCLVRLAGAEEEAKSAPKGNFTDLPSWAAPSIRYAAWQGWINGYSATSFRPSQAVGVEGWYAMLLRLMGYSDADGDFKVGEAAAFARRIGLGDGEQAPFTRGDLFVSMLGALALPRKGGGTLVENLIAKGLVSRAAANAVGLGPAAPLTARQVADRLSAAVFCLDTYEQQFYLDAEVPSANASGFFISTDGLAVTNYHSIEGAIHGTVTLSNGECYPVERVLYYDTSIDIAVMRVSKTSTEGVKTESFAALKPVSSATARSGDAVYALGNPLGLGMAVSAGLVSATERKVDRYSLPMLLNTADISEGSSGGALLNVYGEVFAVTSGAYTKGNNMYLAVPVDPVLTADLTGEGWTLKELKSKEAA